MFGAGITSHVMGHESFENPATAVLMNRAFVNIKDEARFAAGEEVFEFLAALAVHWARAGDGFDEQEALHDWRGNLG